MHLNIFGLNFEDADDYVEYDLLDKDTEIYQEYTFSQDAPL